MKTVIIYMFFIITLLVSVTSCDQDSGTPISGISSGNELVLNQGKKWDLSTGMTSQILKMISIIETTDVATFDPPEISYKLHQEIKMMTSLCSTKGEAHRQLHNYIDPLTEQVLGLRIANDIAKAPLLQSIQTYLNTYNTYFN